MLPRWHILLGMLFLIILIIAFPSIGIVSASIIFVSSILIDFDHYLVYVYRKKDLSLRRAYQWYLEMKKKYHNKKVVWPLVLFHTVEFLILFSVISTFNYIALLILTGFLFHSICDILWIIYYGTLEGREFFLVRYLMNYKNNPNYI